ncbi:MAG: AAA family ATPase, partial [Candidatus Sericytochromatia bacterium]
ALWQEGPPALVLVTGEAGVGKSALVREALPASGGGAIATGKFDQLQHGVPYEGLAQAFRQRLRQLRAAPEPTLAHWRERLQEAIGPHGAVVAEVVPELVDLLGPQPPVPPLEATEARHRFRLTFVGFASALGMPDQPLVIFLDDLQWADPASLALVGALATEAEPGCLRLVGAYRDAEVDAAHPLALALAEIARAGGQTRSLKLGPLGLAHVAELCREALYASEEEARPLAALLQRLSGGNPFFLRQLLQSLLEAGLLRFDVGAGRWRWELGQIERLDPETDVLGLMGQAIGRFPRTTRQLLAVAAALGNMFDPALVAMAAECSLASAARGLWPAVEAGLIHRLGDAHYQFAHDQVQLAAGSWLPADDRLRLHVRIGRLLRAGQFPGGERLLFDTVDHLNRGAALIDEAAERVETAALNLEAGEKARASAAYAAALGYAEAGLALLPGDAWAQAHALCYGLHRLGAECAYLSGDPAKAERLVEGALAHAPSLVARADLYNLRIVAAATAGDHARALALGREGLSLFGVELAPADLPAAIASEMAAVRRHLGGRRVEELLETPELKDENVRACLALLSNLYSPAYMTDQALYALIASMMVHLSVRHGRTVHTAESCIIYGLVLLRAGPENASLAFAFGHLGVAMARAYDGPAVICKVIHVYATILNHWQAPLASAIPLDREAFRAGLACGQFQFAGFATFSIVFNLFDLGTPLEEVLRASEEGLAFGRKIANKLVMDIQTAYRQAIRCLLGLTDGPTRFEDETFEEARFLASAQGAQLPVGLYEILRLRVAYLLGDQAMARRYAVASGERLGYVPGVFSRAEQVFYRALNLAALLEDPGADRPAWLDELAACQAQIEQWAEHAPWNFRHNALLVAAERARIAGAALEAMRLYDQAIEGAEAAGFVQDEAIASELAGRFYLARGQARLGRLHLQAAVACYRRWGAKTKVAALKAEFPAAAVAAASDAVPGEGVAARLDALSLLKAAQALSEEIDLDRLLEKMVAIVLEAAGATRGVLMVDEAGALMVRARSLADGPGLVLERVPVARCAELPQSLIRYVSRAQETVVLGRDRHEALLAGESLALLGLRSVLCMPILKQGRLVGVLYL